MAKTQTTLDRAVKPLYAVAGATDLAVEIARGYVAETQVKMTDAQKKASARVSSVDLEPKSIQVQLERTVSELQGQAKTLPTRVEAYVNDAIADLNETYAELATRGQDVVTRIRKQQATADATAAGKSTVAKAKATRTSAKKGTAAVRSNAKATSTTAKKTAKRSAKAASDASKKVGA